MKDFIDPITKKTPRSNSSDKSHGSRFVDFSDIHNVSDEMLDFFIDSGGVQQGDHVLDVGCGYGALTFRLLKKREQVGDLEITACDVSKTQLSRLIQNIDQTQEYLVNIVQTSADDLPFKEAVFDVVYNKMMRHELPARKQPKALAEVYRSLKNEGRFMIRDLFPTSKKIQQLIQRVVRKKDQLAGFSAQVKNRAFPIQDDLMFDAGTVGFKRPELIKKIRYTFSTKKRLDTEFGGDKEKLDELNKYMRNECMSTLTAQEREQFKYEEKGDTTRILFPKQIFALEKKL